MKLAVVILSGAGDEPAPELGGKTPLAAADLPVLGELCAAGRVGAVHLPEPSLLAGLAGFLGFQTTPAAGALLARATGVAVAPDETAWRCDLVNLFDGKLFDETAGRLGEQEAALLVGALDEALGGEAVRFLVGERWRTLLVIGEGRAREATTTAAAALIGSAVAEHGPAGPDAEFLSVLMERAAEVLGAHEINSVRADLGENPASAAWIWGGGRPGEVPAPELPPGVAVGEHPSFAGLALEAGLTFRRAAEPAGAAVAARAALVESDFVVVHLSGALAASRAGDPAAKVRFLEETDRALLAPLSKLLVAGGQGRILVTAGHAAGSGRRRDLAAAVPFVLAGGATSHYGEAGFTEECAAEADLVVTRAGELLEFAGRE